MSNFTYKNQRGDNYTFNNCVFSDITSRGIIGKIDDYLEQNKNLATDFTNEVLQLTCSERNQIRGIIAEFDEKSKTLVFNPKELQNSLIVENETNPLNVNYIVSGKIKRINGKIIAYVIEELIEIIDEE